MRRARRSARRAAIILGGLLGVCGLAAAASAQEELLQELKKVSRVELIGRRQLSAGAIRKVLKTKSPSFWPWREKPTLRFDYLTSDVEAIRQIYRHNGFLDATASYRVSSSDSIDLVTVDFLIREGERSRIRSVTFQGTNVYPAKDLRKKVWAREDRPFDPGFLQLDTLIISAMYQERGYRPHAAASYRRGDPDSTQVDVTYVVEEGERYKVGEVTVSGHDKVKDRLITRELLLKPGANYQLSRVTRTQEHLYESGLFSQVQIEPLPDSTHTTMNFDVRLRERRPRWIDAGVGSGTDERLRMLGAWGHRNLAGQGLQGTISSLLAFKPDDKKFIIFKRWHIEGSLIEPWLFGTRTRGIVTPFYERYDDREDFRWVVRQEFKGLNFQLRRELNRFARLTLSQENQFVRQELSIRSGIADTIPPATLDSLLNTAEPDYTTHRLSLAFERDLRDNPFSPSRGSTTRLVAELAGGPLRGTSSFNKFEVSASWYTPLRNGWTLATRALGGVIHPTGSPPNFTPVAGAASDPEVARVPLEDRFRSGGVNSIRGYVENVIPPPGSGGLAQLQSSVELRIPTPLRMPLLGTIGLEVYSDIGNVWPQAKFVRWDNFAATRDLDPNAVRMVVGLGPRAELPIGPLRVDVTWRVLPERWQPIVQFALGPSF
ncbi:MAG TPA: BamA/TamA family outer membrane protein [Candidatus Eisenbacteria bacterium]|nr:BamA/TamA family outer membrane protein [Candidatus Eisenbacteria bacterium]